MVSIRNLCVEFAAKPLFTDISIMISNNDKIALVGKNGAGKSTLLKIIAGLNSPTSGVVSISSDTTIGYLPQQMQLADDTSVIEEVKKAFGKTEKTKEEIEQINKELAQRDDYNSTEYATLIDRLQYLNDRLTVEDAVGMDAEIEKTLRGLGFNRTDFDRPTKEFSGGWRMRIELAKILLQRPSLLLLDEPTNHLDIESIQWLENFLITRAKSIVLVSHDRAFIDNVTRRTIEISCGKIYDYKVNYSHFVELRKERVEQQIRAYENQQKQIEDIKNFIERFRYKPTKSVQVQSRIKQLSKIIPIEVDEVDRSHLRLKFPPAPRSGDYPLILEDVGKSYGDHLVFDHAEFTLKRGDKIAFVGKNGEGKSTLVKCIMGEIQHTGNLRIGHNVKIGYFAQNQAQLLDGDITVFDTIDNVATGDMRTKVRDILGAFMFGGEASEKRVKVLSGGEKTRLAMIKLLLEPVNLLILDEPTNHLDMKTKEILKDAIKAFDGTVIVVSHDRDFLDGLVDKVYEFGGGEVKENLGGIYDFLRSKKIDNLSELELSKSPESNLTDNNTEKTNSAQLSYTEKKERDKLIKRAAKAVSDAESKIDTIEASLKEIEEQLSSGDVSNEILNKYSDTRKALENAMSIWEVAQQNYDELTNK
jgi:ATP-binding cassette subfamily F protein 3